VAKKGLGKGLGALLGDGGAEDVIAPSLKSDSGDVVAMLKLVDIEPNRDQPRKSFDDEKLLELADSIKEHGVISPILVSRSDNGYYSIIAGERRWRAAKKAGIKTIPAIIKDFDEIKIQEVALIENLQRQDLNPVEEAFGYKKLMDDFSLTQEQISEKMGKSRSSVANSLRILNLAPDVLDALKNSEISFGHAKVILSLESKKAQSEITKRIIAEDLSVRATEQLLKQKSEKPKKKKKIDLNMKLAFESIEKDISSSLGSDVKITDKGNKGTIQISYYSKDEFDKIIEILNKK